MNFDLVSKILIFWKSIKDYFSELKGLSMKMKITIGLLIFIVAILIISSGIVGCVTPNESYITANYKYSQNALPDLIQYIEKDQNLSNLDKDIRKESVQTK